MSGWFPTVLCPRCVLPFETETSARDDHVPDIISERFQRIRLEHGPYVGQLPGSLLAVVSGDEADLLCQWQVGPVDTVGIVYVVGLDEVVEDLPLVLGHGMYGVMGTAHVGPMRGSQSVVLDVSHDGCTSVRGTSTVGMAEMLERRLWNQG